jgi:hypothetical protein
MSNYDYCKRFHYIPGVHTSFLDVNEPIFGKMLAFGDSLWAGQLCPSPIGIKENSKNAQPLELYPNPTKDKISMKGIDTNVPFEVFVLDVLGKTQFRSSTETEVDLTGLPDGLYFFRVKQNGTDRYCKVVKE